MAGHAFASSSDREDMSRIPEALGWRRRHDLDEAGREAWELPDDHVLLLDPSGRSDSIVRHGDGSSADPEERASESQRSLENLSTRPPPPAWRKSR